MLFVKQRLAKARCTKSVFIQNVPFLNEENSLQSKAFRHSKNSYKRSSEFQRGTVAPPHFIRIPIEQNFDPRM